MLSSPAMIHAHHAVHGLNGVDMRAGLPLGMLVLLVLCAQVIGEGLADLPVAGVLVRYQHRTRTHPVLYDGFHGPPLRIRYQGRPRAMRDFG